MCLTRPQWPAGETDRETDRQTDIYHGQTQTNRQTYTDRQTDRKTNIYTQTHRQTYTTDRHIHTERQTYTHRQTDRQITSNKPADESDWLVICLTLFAVAVSCRVGNATSRLSRWCRRLSLSPCCASLSTAGFSREAGLAPCLDDQSASRRPAAATSCAACGERLRCRPRPASLLRFWSRGYSDTKNKHLCTVPRTPSGHRKRGRPRNRWKSTDVTIIESEIEIELILKNRTESKSIFWLVFVIDFDSRLYWRRQRTAASSKNDS